MEWWAKLTWWKLREKNQWHEERRKLLLSLLTNWLIVICPLKRSRDLWWEKTMTWSQEKLLLTLVLSLTNWLLLGKSTNFLLVALNFNKITDPNKGKKSYLGSPFQTIYPVTDSKLLHWRSAHASRPRGRENGMLIQLPSHLHN